MQFSKELVCKRCLKHFVVNRKYLIRENNFCSRKCYFEFRGTGFYVGKYPTTQIQKKCGNCDKLCSIEKWRENKFKFCSHACKASKMFKGKKISEAKKIAISNSHKGMKKPWASERNKKEENILRGERSPNWKGGISGENSRVRHSKEYKQWIKNVFKRDNWICQMCFKRGGNLEAHHIKSFSKYPELRLDLSNGMTLCLQCHRKTFKHE